MQQILILFVFLLSLNLYSQPFSISVQGTEIEVVNTDNISPYTWGYSYFLIGDCNTWTSPIFAPDDTIYLDPPTSFFEDAFVVRRIQHNNWGTSTSWCLRTWYPVKTDTIEVNTGGVINITPGWPTFQWMTTTVNGSNVEFEFNGKQIPQAVVTGRVIVNSAGFVLYSNVQGDYWLPSGNYYSITVVEAQGGTFLSENHFVVF